MSLVDIAISDLRLDGENPRHDPTKGEQKIVASLMADFGDKIIALADDIATNGLSPIDPPMVIKNGAAYTVVEGNRRLTAVRLLAKPNLATKPADVATLTTFAKRMAAPIAVISCYIAPSRAAARHWQELRHRGQAGGRGVVPWDPEAINRFFGATSGTTAKAILLADAIKAAYPLNTSMLANLDAVMKTNSSTLGRLMSDPNFRDGLGIVLKPAFGSHFSSVDLEPVLMRVLADLTGPSKKKVADFYYQTQRGAYLKGLAPALPDLAKRQAKASPLLPVTTTPPPLPAPVAATSPSAAPAPVPAAPPAAAPLVPVPPAKPTPAGPRYLFEGVRLPKFSVRIRNILGEIQRLPVDDYPNASAVLTRVVLNLAVVEVFEKNGWPLAHPSKGPGKPPKDKTLAELVRGCLDGLDPSGKHKKWSVVRVELGKAHGLFAMSTLNAFIHDSGFNPVPKDLRLISANFTAFLAALDGLLP
jgi:hypothetical protein